MFNGLKFLVWTACAVGLGMYLSTVEIDGRTTVDHLRRAWKQRSAASLSSLRTRVGDALGEAQDALPSSKPKEHHSTEDRDAVNKLIATHGQKG